VQEATEVHPDDEAIASGFARLYEGCAASRRATG
jgi:hypothetical protein